MSQAHGRERQKDTTVLRSSCRTCRRLKRKCNGVSPCSACSTRDLDCVFEKKAKMGRPTQSQSPFSKDADSRTLQDAFQDIFEEMFTSRLPTSGFSVALQSYMTEQAPYLVYGAEDLGEQKPCTPAVYDGLMPMLIQDLIETCKAQYSTLGKEGRSMERKPTYLAIAISRDDDSLPWSSSGPSVEEIKLDSGQVASLSQTWFAAHPLASCITLMDVYGNGSLHMALQSLIASEASTLMGSPHSEQLLDQAHRHYFDTRLPDKDDVASLLLACQVSSLLAWRHTAHTRVKWGIACQALSCQLMAQIESRPECQGAILSNLKSFLSIMTVWSFAQLNRSSGCLTVGLDPAANTLSQFSSSAAQYTSLLLNAHPEVQGISMAKIQDSDFSSLCQQLRYSLGLLSTNSCAASASSTLVKALEHILVLCLLFPRSPLPNDNLPLQAKELTARCNAAIPLLVELANIATTGEPTVPMLQKLTFHRPAQAKGDLTAMKCTVASLLFHTMAQALQALNDIDASGAYWLAIADLSHQLLETPMSLLIETEHIKQSRRSFHSLLERTTSAMSVSPDASVDWFSTTASAQPSLTPDSHTEETSSEPDLFDCLWGELQWILPFDASAAGPTEI